MPDRTINFGESETEATYQIQDTDGAAGGGNFVVAKDTNANTVLLEYQPASDTWQYAGDVDMGGGDITNVNGLTASSAIIGGTVTATDVNTDSVNTDSASVTNQLDAGSVNTSTLTADDSLDISGSVFDGKSPTISDDDVSAEEAQGAKIIIIVNDGAQPAFGLFASNFDTITNIQSDGISIESGVLSGTTGPDDFINISRDGNTIYLENRSGQELTIPYILIQDGI